MRYRTLGGTGIEVSVHCLGTMMFGAVGNADHEDSLRIIHAALDQGINFVDTADMYSAGESEEIVGKALKGRRDDVVLATKVYFQMGEGRNRSGNSRRWIIKEVEESLRRLDTDWIDLYQVHRPDHTTDIEETLSALSDLVRAGKIRAFGCSSFPAEEIVEAHHVAERRALGRFRTEQPPYSIIARGIETSVLPTCRRLSMGVLTWSPLASGFLSGKVRKDQPVDLSTGRAALAPGRFDPTIPANAAKFEAVEKLAELAESIGCSLPELALAFVVTHPAVTSVIIGPRTMEQLDWLLKGPPARSTTRPSTGSTRSCHPEPTSTPRTAPGARTCWLTPDSGGAPSRIALRARRARQSCELPAREDRCNQRDVLATGDEAPLGVRGGQC